jgi:hypothetical protein
MNQNQRRFETRILHCAVACISVADAFVGKIVFDVRPEGCHRDSPLRVLTAALSASVYPRPPRGSRWAITDLNRPA